MGGEEKLNSKKRSPEKIDKKVPDVLAGEDLAKESPDTITEEMDLLEVVSYDEVREFSEHFNETETKYNSLLKKLDGEVSEVSLSEGFDKVANDIIDLSETLENEFYELFDPNVFNPDFANPEISNYILIYIND